MKQYSIQREIKGSFTDVVTRVKEALVQEGFGILTEIDVKQTLSKKLNIEYPDYVILGACHPQSAYLALQQEKEIGLLLPCNVIVYSDKKRISAAAIRPTSAMAMIKNKEVAKIATEVEAKLQRVFTNVRG